MLQSVRFAATTAARLGAVRAMSYKAATEPWFNFEGKTAVVTGAGKGIGHDVCVALAKHGAKVIAVTRSAADLDILKGELGDQCVPVMCDISNVDEIRSKLQAAGDIDLVVNNAGIAYLTPFLETNPDEWDQVMNINVRGAMVVAQVGAQSMKSRGVGGSIVNVSSQASMVGLTDHAAYCASKGAMDQLTRVMAVELGPLGIRTNCVNPTVVMTAMGKKAWGDPAKAAPMLAKIPLGRFCEVEDVVDPILFLLSNRSAMINGAMLPIEGGFLCG